MQAWLDNMAPGYGAALMWTLAALIGLLILLVVIRIVRGLTFGTFVAGGRNRKTRLAVMDATAVDSHRRLVLVRRDDVEHLILIGGPSDVVVEQNIRLLPPARRPAEEPARPPQPEPVMRQAAIPTHAPAPAQPVRQPIAAPRPAPQREPHVSPPSNAAAPSARPASPEPAPGVQTLQPVTVAPAVAPVKAGLDDAMLEELEVTLDRQERQAPAPQPQSAVERSLDEEMSRLLSDLSGPKR